MSASVTSAADIGRLVAEIGSHGGDKIAVVDGVEDLKDAREFKHPVVGGGGRQLAQRDFVEAELRPRQLPVIGGRIMRGRFEERARVLFAAQRLRGAGLPIV